MLLWSCCNCKHASMTVAATIACPNPNCGHVRCSVCPTESPTGWRSKGTFSSTSDDESYNSKRTSQKVAQSTNADDRGQQKYEDSSTRHITSVNFAESRSDYLPETSSGFDSLGMFGRTFNPFWLRKPATKKMQDSKLQERSTHTPDVVLISIVPSRDNEMPLFPLNPDLDSNIVTLWHESILPKIETDKALYPDMTSVHLFRQGLTERNSYFTILVSIANGADKSQLQEKISQLVDEPLRPSFRISFEVSTVRRTVSHGPPPICKPRNTEAQALPTPGASIGIKNEVDCTATLGGYLLIDGKMLILTVDHLIPENASKHDSIILTHPSQQESQYTDHWNKVQSYFAVLRSCCQFCQNLLVEHSENSDFYKPVILPDFNSACITSRLFSKAKQALLRNHPVRNLGPLVARSGLRSAVNVTSDGKYSIEMDWALFEVEEWSEALELHAQELSKGMSFSQVVPGVPISATGRTSGYQTGITNTVMSIVRHGSRFTREWSVYKDNKTTLQEWIEGGIGVDGDSGSWIIGDSGVIYGMVWGRDRPNTNPIALFTPIHEIIADITERTGAVNICLPFKAESSLAHGKGKQKGDVSKQQNNKEQPVVFKEWVQKNSGSIGGIRGTPDEWNQDRQELGQKEESSDLLGLVGSLRISEARSATVQEIEIDARSSSIRQ